MIENTIIFNYLCYVVQTFKKKNKKRNILPTQKDKCYCIVSGGIQKNSFDDKLFNIEKYDWSFFVYPFWSWCADHAASLKSVWPPIKSECRKPADTKTTFWNAKKKCSFKVHTIRLTKGIYWLPKRLLS